MRHYRTTHQTIAVVRPQLDAKGAGKKVCWRLLWKERAGS